MLLRMCKPADKLVIDSNPGQVKKYCSTYVKIKYYEYEAEVHSKPWLGTQ